MWNPPTVTSDSFASLVRDHFPDARTKIEPMNPVYQSCRMEVSRGNTGAEIVWGPLTGFGGIDPTLPDDGNIFKPFDVPFDSVEEVIQFLSEVLNRKSGAKE